MAARRLCQDTRCIKGCHHPTPPARARRREQASRGARACGQETHGLRRAPGACGQDTSPGLSPKKLGTQGSLHYTPEHCLVKVVSLYFGGKRPCFKWLQNVSFKEPWNTLAASQRCHRVATSKKKIFGSEVFGLWLTRG